MCSSFELCTDGAIFPIFFNKNTPLEAGYFNG
jgi:hypothetical protein